MNLLTPRLLPFVFLGIAVIYGVTFLRHRGRPGQDIAQRNRLRMAAIFGAVGVGWLISQL